MSNKPTGIFYIDPVSAATLRADISADRERAEKAEAAAAIWEQRCSQATALSGKHLADLAAALREQDALRAHLESAEDALRDIKRRHDIGRSGDETLSGPIRTNGFPVEAENCWCNECVRGLVEAALGAAGERSEG